MTKDKSRTNKITRFRVMHEDGRGYTVYTQKSGRWFAYGANWDERRGFLVISPSQRVSNRSAEVARESGQEF